MGRGNDLRRTIEKLRVLNETPYIHQIIYDAISIYDEDRMDNIITQLEKYYKEYIKENTTENPKQGKIL